MPLKHARRQRFLHLLSEREESVIEAINDFSAQACQRVGILSYLEGLIYGGVFVVVRGFSRTFFATLEFAPSVGEIAAWRLWPCCLALIKKNSPPTPPSIQLEGVSRHSR